MLVARGDSMKRIPRCHQKIVEAILAAEDFYDRNREQAQRAITARLGAEGLDPEIWKNIDFYTGLSATLLTLLNVQYNWYAPADTQSAFHPIKFLEPDLIARVNPSKVTFR